MKLLLVFQFHNLKALREQTLLLCPIGKVLNVCGDHCQVTCADVNGGKLPKICPLICGPPACVCPVGLALKPNGLCVPYILCR
uniref:TIL domain-containing protein n=1 Tax=Romanomermis culicivorax TaxID=13658 RepID=A0A915JEP8_ROMCU